MDSTNDSETTPTDVSPGSVSNTKETSVIIQSILFHPVIAANGFIGSIASIIGLVAFFIPPNHDAPFAISAIVSAMSFVEDSKREQYYSDHHVGQHSRFEGQRNGALTCALTPDGEQVVQFGMTYIFATKEGLRVHAMFDEAMRDVLPILDPSVNQSTAVEGVLHDVDFSNEMVVHIRSATLPEYSLVRQ